MLLSYQEWDKLCAEGKCFNCKEKGHIARNCPEIDEIIDSETDSDTSSEFSEEYLESNEHDSDNEI